MIQKKITTIWLNDNPVLPDDILKWISSQRLPGFDHHIITLDNMFDGDSPLKPMPYLQGCVHTKKWAKAADYIRMAFIYHYGGIYLDADTEVLKPFPDEILNNMMFITREANGFCPNGIFGAIPEHSYVEAWLLEANKWSYEQGMDDKVFEYGMELWTTIVSGGPLAKEYPAEYFVPYDHQTGIINVTPNTITYHHYKKSWL
jgi:mannosyltransferase OCH1-like enzyme